MTDLERLLRAVRACAHEGVRRDLGSPADPRFDVPLAMLLDLADELAAPGRDVPADVDALIEDLHGRL